MAGGDASRSGLPSQRGMVIHRGQASARVDRILVVGTAMRAPRRVVGSDMPAHMMSVQNLVDRIHRRLCRPATGGGPAPPVYKGFTAITDTLLANRLAIASGSRLYSGRRPQVNRVPLRPLRMLGIKLYCSCSSASIAKA